MATNEPEIPRGERVLRRSHTGSRTGLDAPPHAQEKEAHGSGASDPRRVHEVRLGLPSGAAGLDAGPRRALLLIFGRGKRTTRSSPFLTGLAACERRFATQGKHPSAGR